MSSKFNVGNVTEDTFSLGAASVAREFAGATALSAVSGMELSKRQAIFVLGAHRSGTSAVTRMANLLGAHLPSKILGINESNPQGHWEPEEVIALHDDALKSARSSWFDLFDIDEHWFTSIEAAEWAYKIKSYIIRELTKYPIFVVKDPRICLLFPLWISALRQIGIEPRCILPFRSPIEVAESLTKRNAHAMPGGFLPPEHGYLLWLRYVLAAERHTRGLQRSFVAFDALLSDWESEADRIADQLGIVWPLQDRGTRGDISAFLSREYKHQNQGAGAPLSRLGSIYERVYFGFQSCVQEPGAGTATFDDAHREFLDATQLVVDYLRSFSGAIERLDNASNAKGVLLEDERRANSELTKRTAELAAVAIEHEAKIDRLETDLEEAAAAAERFTRDINEARSQAAKLESTLKTVSDYSRDLGRQARKAESAATAAREEVQRLASEAAELQAGEDASEMAWSQAQERHDLLIRQRRAILQTPAGRLKSVARSIVRPEHDLAGPQLKFMTRLVNTVDETRLLYSQFQENRATRLGAEELAHAAEPKASEMEGAAAALRKCHEQIVLRINRVNDSYAEWAKRYDSITDADRNAIQDRLSGLAYRPLISVVMPVFNPPVKLLSEAVGSVISQLYPDWQLCIADDASTSPEVTNFLGQLAKDDDRIQVVMREENGHICAATNTALMLAKGEFVALMDHDDLLPEHALFEVVSELNRDPQVDIIYSDEDHIDDLGRRSNPYFKTDYNPDLMLAHNLVSHLGVYRRALIKEIGGFRLGYEGSQDYDLALRAIDATSPERVRHIPAVLYHWRQATGKETFSEAFMEKCISSARRAIADHLQRKGQLGHVVEHPRLSLWQRVIRPVPEPAPLVSVIIPTRDKAGLLRRCVDGVMNRTDYPNVEIVIVDHQSVELETVQLFREMRGDQRVRIIPYEGAFNYSAINNFAVSQARGDIIAFLNNDVDVISQEWLSEMTALAVLPEVGAVGAKLLYPDGRVQHAGVVLGVGGVANHFFHLLDGAETGYLGRAVLTSTVSAVTAACLVLRRAVFEQVGGFDAHNLPVAFNDVDLCLRIRELGYRNVWAPHALLFHHESASRGDDQSPEHIDRFRREVEFMQYKWGEMLQDDAFYNPNLNIAVGDFTLAYPPRRRAPWQVGRE